MGIYNNENARYLFIFCKNCQYKGEIIDVVSDLSKIVCPACGRQVEQARALDTDLCEDRL